MGKVLIVDDEADIRELLSMTLQRMGLETDCAASEFEAVQLLQRCSYDLCLTEMRLPDGDGLKLLEHVTAEYGSTPVAVITAHGSTENAVAALKAGAFDYLAKPVSLEQLRSLVRSALKLPRPNAQRKGAESHSSALPVLLGDSSLMQQTRQMIDRLARSQAPVHISGESGSGKEMAARLMHMMGPRRDAPFVPVNCGAIPENLMESEFFGYRKGAFTGADQDKEGFFQAASSGTLFLDEVADLPIQMQVKLLRAIQEKKVRKVGATAEENVDVRIISATHHHLGDAVRDGKFRQDLYYRLNVIELRMPSLREMPDDIPVLAQDILRRSAGGERVALLPEAIDALRAYPFPGNVRELENILERALALCAGDRIGREELQLASPAARTESQASGDLAGLPLQEHLDRVEKAAILDALAKTRFNRTAAAKLLGITFRALRYRMERLGIN
jgi:two-component system response regulator PilR (NtrC family)